MNMDIKKQSGSMVPDSFVEDRRTYETTGIEDGAEFTGVKETPYGEGSYSPEKNEQDKKVEHKRFITYYRGPDGKIYFTVDPEAFAMHQSKKSLMDKILSRLAAEDPAVPAPAEEGISAQDALMESLGAGPGTNPEEAKQILKYLSDNFKKFDIEDMASALEKTATVLFQLGVKAKEVNGILAERNSNLKVDKDIAQGIQQFAHVVQSDVLSEATDELYHEVVRMDAYSLMYNLLKTISFENPKTGKKEYWLKILRSIKGKEVSEKSLAEADAAAKSLVEKYNFLKQNGLKIEDAASAISKALDRVKKTAGKEAAKQSMLRLVQYLTEGAKKKQAKLLEAYNKFRSESGKYVGRFPDLKPVMDRMSEGEDRLNKLKIEATNDPGVDIDNLLSVAKQMSAEYMQLQRGVDETNNIFKLSEQSLEQVTPEAQPEEQPAEEPVEAPESPEAQAAYSFGLTITSAELSSVISLLDQYDSEDYWKEAATAMGVVAEEYRDMASDAEDMLAEVQEPAQELNEFIQVAGAEELSPVEEVAPSPEMAPAMATASKADPLGKKAIRYELDPSQYLDVIRQEKGKTKEDYSAEYEKIKGNIVSALKEHLDMGRFFKMLENKFADFAGNISSAIAKAPGSASSEVQNFRDAIKEAMIKRAPEVTNNPNLKEIIDISEKMRMPEDAGHMPALQDVLNMFISELGKGDDRASKLLHEFFKKDDVKLQLANATGGKYVIQFRMERVHEKGEVNFDELFELYDSMKGQIDAYLDEKIAELAGDEKKALPYKELKKYLLKLRGIVAKTKSDMSQENLDASAVALKEVSDKFNSIMDQYGIEDVTMDAFADDMRSILQGKGEKMPQPSASLDSLFVNAAEDVAEEAGSDVKEDAEKFVAAIWPGIMDIANSYVDNAALALENAVDEIEAMSGAPAEESEPEEEMGFAMPEPAMAMAADKSNGLDKVADTVTSTCPNDMYSHFDLSENTLEMIEEAGKKVLRVNKNLRNLVTKRMNEFFKGAYNAGDMVNVDREQGISCGTVKAYLGNNIYKISVDGSEIEVHEKNLFKI